MYINKSDSTLTKTEMQLIRDELKLDPESETTKALVKMSHIFDYMLLNYEMFGTLGVGQEEMIDHG